MSTAILRHSSQHQQRALSDQAPHHLRDMSNDRSSSHPILPRLSRQEEKNQVIANYEIAVGRETLPAEQIPQDPRRKQLGFSSQELCVNDFELMKTLGTGMNQFPGMPGVQPSETDELTPLCPQAHSHGYGWLVLRTRDKKIVTRSLR